MAYTKIKLVNLASNNELPIFRVLMNTLNISMNEAQRLIDTNKVLCNGQIIKQKNARIQGLIELVEYESKPRGIKPVFENENFALFDKESGVLTHPNGRHCKYSLCDEIWYLWGKQACVAHRLDKQTSGLILVAKNQFVAKKLKKMFENKEIHKEYLALVRGKTALNFSVNAPLALSKEYDDIKTRMQICPMSEGGKEAKSEFERLEFFQTYNASLLLCKPKTGRQHQLRLHLFHVKHSILGETLYGLSKPEIENILDEKLSLQELQKLCGASRLCLHSYRLKFKFENEEFDFYSQKDIKTEFLNALA
ncbi:RNA pseudouridine synthase [Campylobacter sp. MIT 12-5580]|uniref:RluA family pseudouridine synthase n=1 Tax=Campylobacter sp. MIT 12-5580 TaxID=2040651 RepID=UPI0010F916B8|nr:RluA family pseudouridine synthase [Campylobacter sp. MIT 12-5580]TKX29633.1 RNA pseudouridine synthase [Campylobacter sp. MIT 12-5580]